MKVFFYIIYSGILIITGSHSVHSQETSLPRKEEKPNLILFMADDCSYLDIGCYGSNDSHTPNIDKFAEQGIRFSKAYQAAPMCSPTRHNLLTGIWPVKSGAYPNHTKANIGTASIIHHLHPAGYKVALVGKSHVAPESVFPWDLYVPLKKNNELDFAAIDSFIIASKKEDSPFCIYVMSNQPHTPWNKGNQELFDQNKITLPSCYVDITQTRIEYCKYLAEVNFMDEEFGRLLDIVDKNKIVDNSVVFFLSEQGNSFPFAKWTCYDVGVHSACIVRWPDKIEVGVTSDAIIEYVDFVPTFLEIAEAKAVASLDGESFLPIMRGERKQHKKFTFSLQTTRGILKGSDFYGIRSVADNKYRYILNLTPNMRFQNVETEGDLFNLWQDEAKRDSFASRITEKYQKRPKIELYDIEIDPYCMNNIADDPKNKNTIQTMDKVLKEWMLSCGDKGQDTELEALQHQTIKYKTK